MSSIGKAIVNLREEKGHQSKYVALTAGISCDRYSRIETGTFDPSDDELVAIAFALDADVSTIIREWENAIILQNPTHSTLMHIRD